MTLCEVPDESFSVELVQQFSADGNPYLMTDTTKTTVTIVDDGDAGELYFTASSITKFEREESFTATVTRVGGDSGPVSVTWTTLGLTATGGVDYGSLNEEVPSRSCHTARRCHRGRCNCKNNQ